MNGEIKKIMSNLTDNEITAFIMDKNQKRFAIGDNFGEIKIYNYLIGLLMKKLSPHNGEIVSVLFCEKDKKIVTGSSDCFIYIHDDKDLYSTQLLRTIPEFIHIVQVLQN